MTLLSKIQWFPLVSGLQEGVDPRTAPPGTMQRLVNAAWTKDGLLDKRAGTAPYVKTRSDAGTVTSAARLATRKNELLLIDTTGVLFSYSADLAAWVPKGQMPFVALKWDSFAANDGIRCADIGITTDNKQIEAWVSGDPAISDIGVPGDIKNGTLYVRITDRATGQVLKTSSGFTGTTITCCRVIVSGTSWAIIFDDNGTLRLLQSDMATAVNLVVDGNANFKYMPFDAVAVGSTIVVCTHREIATSVRLFSFDFLGTAVAGPVNVLGGGTADHVSCIGMHATAGENLYVIVGNKSTQAGSVVQYAVHNPTTLAQTLAPVTVDNTASMTIQHVGVTRVDATHASIAWTARTLTRLSGYVDGITSTRTVDTAGVSTSKRGTNLARMLSRPFNYNGKVYLLLVDMAFTLDTSATGGTATSLKDQFIGRNSYLVEVETAAAASIFTAVPHRYVGRIDPLIAGEWQHGCSPLPVALSTTEMIAFSPFAVEAPVDAFQLFQGVRRVHILSGASLPPGQWASAEVGGETHFAAPVLTTYDSNSPFDFGFPRATPIAVDDSQGGSSTRGNTGGVPAMVDGSYFYQTVPLFYSGAGIIHRGPPSPPIKFTLAHGGANDNKLTLAILDQTLGCKFSFGSFASFSRGCVNELYRTEVNLSQLHKRTIEPSTLLELNSPFTSPNVTIVDQKADASIAAVSNDVVALGTRPVIYTDVELEEIAPPACLDLHLHKNRLFALAGNEHEAWVSKDYAENPQFAPGFNEDMRLVFDVPLTGIETLDDKVVFFAENAILYTIGDGPASNGDGQDYSITKIQADAGCISSRSIVSFGDGIMYQSAKGLYALLRNLEVRWIGKPIQATLDAFPVVTSAVFIQSLNQVRFTCNNTAGDHGIVLVYDTVRKQWSRFEYTDGAVSQCPIADSIMFGGVWHFVTPGGQVYREDVSTYLDGGTTFVAYDVESTEIFAEGPLGYQRVRRAYINGERFTDSDVTVRVAAEALPTYDSSRSWSSAELVTVGSGNVGIHVKRQKCSSFRVRVTDAAPSSPGAVVGNGRGVSLSSFGFEIAPMRGMDKRRAEARK